MHFGAARNGHFFECWKKWVSARYSVETPSTRNRKWPRCSENYISSPWNQRKMSKGENMHAGSAYIFWNQEKKSKKMQICKDGRNHQSLNQNQKKLSDKEEKHNSEKEVVQSYKFPVQNQKK